MDNIPVPNNSECEDPPAIFEDCSSDQHVTASHSRSASGSRDCGQRADYEIVEFNDSNGQYFVMKQRSPLDSGTTAMNGVAENGDLSPLMVTSSPLEVFSSSPARTPSCGKTPTDQTETPHAESRRWLKSPSSPALPVTDHLAQGRARPSSGNSTPTHAGGQNHLFPSSTLNHDGNSFMFPVEEVIGEREKITKQGSRKKKRSPSWYNVLNSSYKQKNEGFHKLFKDLPETERLMSDYTCALMKDILVQGRMYASQNYICFHSNILKWQTAMVISLKNVEKLSKEKTVKLFPNAIQLRIKGREKALTFTSFTQREKAYIQLYKLWRNALREKPLQDQELLAFLRSNSSQVQLPLDDDATTIESPTEENRSPTKKTHQKRNRSPSHFTHKVNGKAREESSEESKASSSDSSGGEDINNDLEQEKNSSNGARLESNNRGAYAHAKDDLRRVYLNREFPVPADYLFKTVFDPECEFWKDYLVGKGSYGVEIGEWNEGCDDNEGNQVKKLSYNLALTNPLGPKSSKVEETQILYKESIQGCCYAVDCIAQTVGVPYSEYFTTNMRYCIRRLTDSTCELRITAEIEYRKTPWGLVKNFIDKNVHEGMEENFQLLEQELDKYLSLHASGLFIAPADEQKSEVRRRRRHRHKKRAHDAPTRTIQQNQGDPTSTDDKHVTAAPSIAAVALPCNDVSTGPIYETSERVRESKSGKLLLYLAFAMLVLLLLSNYQMYNRLNVLEHSHSKMSETGELPIGEISVLKSCNGLYGESQALCHIAERVNNLETLIQKHMTASDTWWRYITAEWNRLRGEIDKIIQKFEKEGTT